ncbi:hypothetical protein DL764_008520 [Monosporascus ibericus]|uniref:Protein kinase domain-containing protein n=1 Tax=Monosporascus ibericus TaxID=155417 RepID=A0A4Q4SZH8_9PEZI|nr:hypothetical protein DL764_008520 [Monosporascus ibericus]
MYTDRRASREAERVRRYFDDGYTSYYKYWGIIETGKWGVALLCRQKKRENPNREERWFVVKRVFDELMQDKLHKEIKILKRLRGAPHIVQVLAIDPDPFEALSRGALIMEHVENGTVGDIIYRMKEQVYPFPNRVLLRFFVCPMAWPDRGKESRFLIGDPKPPGGEHDLVPILKLIDFGEALYDPNPYVTDMGVKINIFHIGRLMRMLISLDTSWELPPGEVTMSVQGGGERAISTASACIAKPNYPNLDDGLRNLVMLCTAVKVEDRPSLDWLWDTLMNLIFTRTPAYYAQRNLPWAQLEEDGPIQDLIHYIVYHYGPTNHEGIEAGETEGIE